MMVSLFNVPEFFVVLKHQLPAVRWQVLEWNAPTEVALAPNGGSESMPVDITVTQRV
jgi:hypothetical protein